MTHHSKIKFQNNNNNNSDRWFRDHAWHLEAGFERQQSLQLHVMSPRCYEPHQVLQSDLSTLSPSVTHHNCTNNHHYSHLQFLIMAALHSRSDIIFLPCGFFFFLSFFFFFLAYLRGRSGCLPYFYTWCGLSANLECRSEMCCTRFAGNTGRKNDAKNHHLGTIAQLCRAISSQLRHVSTIGKNLLNSNSDTCPHNMVNFGPLTAEICWRVWGTPANFNGFRVLAPLLHGTLVVGVSQTLWR